MKIFSKVEIYKKLEIFLTENERGVVSIFGPTASGKTELSVEIAKRFGPAEIISVDSRQVFRDIDISSAKISKEEMQGIKHWGLNLVNPDEQYSVVDFQKYAFMKINEILEKGSTPIICGGTMLWLDSVTENYVFGELGEKSTRKSEPKWPIFKIGINWDREELYARTDLRAEIMFKNGLIEETKNVLEKYDFTQSAFTSFGYEEIKRYLDGNISYEKALQANQKKNRNYAKRQLTWWRGRNDLFWIDGRTIKK